MNNKQNNTNKEKDLKSNEGNLAYPEYGDREEHTQKDAQPNLKNTFHTEW
ncbi:hypothetical protein ACFOU2_19935 [Bacillus songklensis]|uniref:Catalase n=1 Tax=Bacillus songklensis TaxID=1069116 RepID=A0ABV8B888_9BACI